MLNGVPWHYHLHTAGLGNMSEECDTYLFPRTGLSRDWRTFLGWVRRYRLLAVVAWRSLSQLPHSATVVQEPVYMNMDLFWQSPMWSQAAQEPDPGSPTHWNQGDLGILGMPGSGILKFGPVSLRLIALLCFFVIHDKPKLFTAELKRPLFSMKY